MKIAYETLRREIRLGLETVAWIEVEDVDFL